MAARVLSTDQAKTAVQQVQQIVNGGLAEQISKLDAQGKTGRRAAPPFAPRSPCRARRRQHR